MIYENKKYDLRISILTNIKSIKMIRILFYLPKRLKVDLYFVGKRFDYLEAKRAEVMRGFGRDELLVRAHAPSSATLHTWTRV